MLCLGPAQVLDQSVDHTEWIDTDRQTWTRVVEVKKYLESFAYYEPTPARYVRITGASLWSNPHNAGTYRMQFAEVEIYGRRE